MNRRSKASPAGGPHTGGNWSGADAPLQQATGKGVACAALVRADRVAYYAPGAAGGGELPRSSSTVTLVALQ
jgi:hypothetical protein